MDFYTGNVLKWDSFNGKLRFIVDTTNGYAILTNIADNDDVIKTKSITISSNPAMYITNCYYANQIMGFTDTIKKYIE